MTRLYLLLLATAAPAPLLAQSLPPAAPEAPSPDPAPSPAADSADEDEEAITVVGQRQRGSVIGDIPPENVLDARDIRATGATSIGELLDAVSAQTGSARGRSSGRPVLLLNGQRISGFRELRDLPPEAIQRMEVLPEEVAIKYGYAADQRVVNIVLRRRFQATTVELRGEAATDGDYASGRAEATRLTIRDNSRTSVNLRLGGNTPLYESERAIALDPAATVDERDSRTLVGSARNARLTATHNRPLGESGGISFTGEAALTDGRSRFGLADYDSTSRLTRDSNTATLGLGSVANLNRGSWRLSVVGNADYERSESRSDRSLVGILTDDKSLTERTSVALDGTATGPLFTLPAGSASVTVKAGLSRVDLDSEARRRDLFTETSLGRTQAETSASLDLPLLTRDSGIGRLSLNLNGGVTKPSDFDALVGYGAGLTWSPTGRLNLLASFNREEGAPSLQTLGNPLVETAGVPFFDAVRGETVDVTTLTGGNPDLAADRRTVWKLGGNWQAMQTPELRLRAEYVSETIRNPQIGFPAATPALEAAFPGRFVRDTDGTLLAVDLRPVNGERSRRDQLRWGFDLTQPLASARPSREQIQALVSRFAPPGARPPASPPGEGPPPSADGPAAGGPPRGGFGGGGGRGGGGGGFFGGRNGGRLTLSMTHTVTFKDQLAIAPGLPVLDYLDGEATGSFGGRPRHTLEVQGGYYNNGLGIRLNGNWRSATRVDGTGGDLRFNDYATLDLRLFANLGERFDLVSKSPFFLGSSLRLDITNIANERPSVRGADGLVPFAYQEDRLEPTGRTISVSFRKLFLPRRFFQNRGGARPN